MTGAEVTCPKHMVYGPCGGVTAAGGCEVDAALPCPFVDAPTVRWDGTDATAAPPTEPAASRPKRTRRRRRRRARPSGTASAGPAAPAAERPERWPAVARGDRWCSPTCRRRRWTGRRSCAAPTSLADGVDAVLIGDHPGARVQFPPSYRALLLRDRGVAVWAGLNCRDRNRVALEGELAALADAGAAAVHCVTGDHTAVGHRPDAAPVFDLDATRLAAAGPGGGPAGVGGGVAVRAARRPAPGPAGREGAGGCPGVRREPRGRAGGGRRVRRGRAGDPVHRVRARWCSGPAQARLLAAFPGLVLPPGFLDGILDARDPVVAGIDAAVRLAEELLDVPGCAGRRPRRRAGQGRGGRDLPGPRHRRAAPSAR